MSDRNHSSRSPVSRSRSPSAHSGRNHSPERSRTSSQSLRPSYSRSRSRSHSRKNRRKHSRSHSRSRRSDRRKDYYRSHSRSPFSNRRRHLGSRVVQSSSVGGPNFKHIDIGSENPPTGRCLGVFGLSLYTQDKDLKDVFSKYGPIDQVQVVYDHHTGRSRGFAFVYFENSEDAHMAKERCNGLEVDGRRIRVDYSITQRAHTPTPGVYMGKPTSRYRRSPYRRISNRYSRSRSRSYSRSPPPRRY